MSTHIRPILFANGIFSPLTKTTLSYLGYSARKRSGETQKQRLKRLSTLLDEQFPGTKLLLVSVPKGRKLTQKMSLHSLLINSSKNKSSQVKFVKNVKKILWQTLNQKTPQMKSSSI